MNKKIIVSCIILLLTTTPLIASARINENKQNLSMNVYEGNSLGTVTVEHQPILWGYFKYHGINTSYTPPSTHPTFDYYFPELENGTVCLNFTVTIKHYLNYASIPYFAQRLFPNNFRYTWVNRLHMSRLQEPDIFSIENKNNCTSQNMETYNITVDGIYYTTNGANITFYFWLYGFAAITPFSTLHDLTNTFLLPWRHNFLSPYCNPYNCISITIHPI
ncbi:MAG: hypothetical protein NTY91_01230 [Euryarchaeota archaeon]|nr:hypothetical protein [Euryarchaeota archaeon]